MNEQRNLRLKAAENLRPIEPRCCATCKYLEWFELPRATVGQCQRQDGVFVNDVSLRTQYHWVCDGHKFIG
jgi:hypothetical protein